MINNTSDSQKRLIGVVPAAIISAVGIGSVKVSISIMAVMSACIVIIHQRLVLTTSTIGLQMPFRNHGKYSSVVKNAMSPFGTPILVNIITEMLFTRKYGIPSAKYNVGTQNHGVFTFSLFMIFMFYSVSAVGLFG